MKINWKNMGISIGIGIILAVLFLVIVGFSWILCKEPVVSIVEGSEYDNSKYCSIPAELGYFVAFVIGILSTLGFYFLLGCLQKRKTSKNN